MNGPRVRAIVVAAIFVLVGITNIVPGIVAILPERTMSLYGIALSGDSLTLLMRHRAVLLAIVGGLLLLAAWRPSLRPVAIGVALASKFAFFALCAAMWPVADPVLRVATIDAVAVVLLLAALVLSRR